MRFSHPHLATAIPLILAVFWWLQGFARRRRLALREAFAGGTAQPWSNPGFSASRQRIDRWMSLVALGCLLLTLARPLIFLQDEQAELQGVPYLLGLDVSRSMLATDIPPSRYGAATNALDRFFQETQADRVGIITFAGVAYLNAPLTFDMSALRTILRYIQPEDLIDPGSAISSAIDRAGIYFTSNNIQQRVLVLVSDGEDLEGRPVESARRWFREHNLKICTIGVGTAAGTKIPIRRGGQGAVTNTFGQQVTTRLNESNLQRIANAGGGRYYRLGDHGEGLRQLRSEFLAPLAETAARENLQNYREFFQIPLSLATFILIARMLLGADRFQIRLPLPSVWPKADSQGSGTVRRNL